MKKIGLLGASGSIGTQTIDVLKDNRSLFELVAFSVGKNIEYANQLIELFPSVKLVSVQNKEDVSKINHNNVVCGEEGLIKVATYKTIDVVVTAVVGSVGLLPTIKAIEEKKNIALANKETLVTAGHLIMPLVKKHGVALLPVDSEHSAIFQALNGERHQDVAKIILTASGGSFRDKSIKYLEKVTVKEALEHPNWSMGEKITIDSATMFNKGLEVIEAHYLFDIDYQDIEVLIHKESIVHSMVEYRDGSVIAQLGTPDMKLPIQYALTYPERIEVKRGKRLKLSEIQTLHFDEVDYVKYNSLKIAYQAGQAGHSVPTVLNAANEVAVELFLKKKISFLEISELVKQTIEEHDIIKNPNLKQIIELDQKIRKKIKESY